jgi:hypothetical protein
LNLVEHSLAQSEALDLSLVSPWPCEGLICISLVISDVSVFSCACYVGYCIFREIFVGFCPVLNIFVMSFL